MPDSALVGFCHFVHIDILKLAARRRKSLDPRLNLFT
jgi:hypothetical protein